MYEVSKQISDTIIDPNMGYYTVGEKVFRSKNLAALYAQSVNAQITWHFNDEIFSRNNWAEEPTESLDCLYNQRARELRETYDYIVISYSGGADSYNIVESFLRQNLHIDEILVNINSNINKLIVNNLGAIDNWNYGAEYKLQIYPRLEEIRLKSPKTKITVVDTSENILETLRNNSDGEFIINTYEPLNISGVTRFNYIYFHEIRKRFDHHTKIGIIVGIDKPRCYVKKDKFYIAFIDRITNICPLGQHFKEYDNTRIEFFYWHPSSLKILTKQCHVIRRWLEHNPRLQRFWRPKDVKDFYDIAAPQQELLRTVLYSNWNTDWFQVGKDTKWWYSEIDEWWHRNYSDTNEYKIWKSGIDYLTKYASNFVIEKEGRPDGLTPFVKTYCIGDAPKLVFYT